MCLQIVVGHFLSFSGVGMREREERTEKKVFKW